VSIRESVAKSNATRSVAEKMRRAMTAQGLSQADVARRAGVAQSTVGRIVNGTNSATMDTLESIASALGISVAEITSGAVSADFGISRISASRTEAERMAHLSQVYAACDEEAKELLVVLAERLATSKPRKAR
jgi:transcriptional regulator with XRE-family HTH domain